MFMLCLRFAAAYTRVLVRLRGGVTEEDGATVAEYALVLVLVTLAVITVLGSLGEALQDKIGSIVETITGTTPP